jgi:serine/threonine protein kinase
MQFVHSRGAIHRDLKPENILLDWDWTVRIADFGRSIAPMAPERYSIGDSNVLPYWPSIDWRYLAPECYENVFHQASDVFAFGMILFEILTARPAFPEDCRLFQIAFMIAIEDARPEIPDFVHPLARGLIEDCWAANPDDRPTFAEIVDRLAWMEFKVTADVNSAKVAMLMIRIDDWEARHWDD